MHYQNRHIPLTGAKNFRDFGGYATACGGIVKERVLYRSDRLSELSSDDFSKISALGIRNICDLRGSRERRNAPTNWDADPAPNILHMPLINEKGTSTFKMILSQIGSNRDQSVAREIMLGIYESLVTDQQALVYYRQIFELIAGKEGLPVLIHCSGGKDRTGVTCALIHWALGVGMEDIMADFMMSQTLFSERVDFNALAPQVFDYAADQDWNMDALLPVINVEPVYLKTVFRLLKQNHGTVEAFLCDALGLDAPIIARIRHNLIVNKNG